MLPITGTNAAASVNIVTPTTSPTMTTMRKRKFQRKTVTFNTCVTVKECLHRNEYSPHERAATWYDRREMFEIKLVCRQTVKAMKKGMIDFGSDSYCTRGLEKHVHRSPDVVLALVSVLREQHRQFCNGMHSPEDLSTLYQQISLRSKMAAYATALRDREAIAPLTPSAERNTACKESANRTLCDTTRLTQQRPTIGCRAT